MKKTVLILFLLISAEHAAQAQMKSTTRAECTRRCMASDSAPLAISRHEDKMKSINSKKRLEKDPGKIKEIEQEESNELDRFEIEHENICKQICGNNPEK
ncbi:hypothetical protein [Pseudoduganella aquatica]|uniref:hypothetical protein n=1 Tax=Pseudoduganella aquatica TaxID=2660641 RepID=UPI001E2DA4FB|nr:hypothetical protein [Pseudoduganella aquatica]